MSRTHYLATYDIRDPKRLQACFRHIMKFTSTRQYSCFECYLSPIERQELLEGVEEIILDEDSFALLRIMPKDEIKHLGLGVWALSIPELLWVG